MSLAVDPRALHDLLEEAYLQQMAQGGGRWFERRRDGYVLAGFAGLDSPTMSRIALVNEPQPSVRAMLADATAFFSDRGLPWCVHVTPFSRPAGLARELEASGFWLASDLDVMTWEDSAPPLPKPDVRVERATSRDAGRFTSLLIDGFRMPARYLAALTDINRAWIEHGAAAALPGWQREDRAASTGGGTAAFFAYVDGVDEPVGTALLSRAGDVATVYNVCTPRAYRRRGIATTLMHALLSEFLDHPARVLNLQVARGSEASRMYSRMGFVPRYRWELYTRP